VQQNHLYNAELQSVKVAKHLENNTTGACLPNFVRALKNCSPQREINDKSSHKMDGSVIINMTAKLEAVELTEQELGHQEEEKQLRKRTANKWKATENLWQASSKIPIDDHVPNWQSNIYQRWIQGVLRAELTWKMLVF